MRKFKTHPFGDEVDLDDESTYDYLPKSIKELDDLMFREIGYSYCYFTYFHSDWYKPQVKKIKKLIKVFTSNRKKNYNNLKWFQEQVFIFQNEIENMC